VFSVDYILDRKLYDIIYALEVFGSGTLPNTAQAVARAADAVVGVWTNTARGAFKRTTGGYAHGIESGKIYPYNGDQFHSAVINTAVNAKSVEYGRTSSDVQKILSTSNKVRVSKKDNRRYLIIPFRHGVPGSVEYKPMTKDVYKVAKELTVSRKTGARTEPSQQGAKTFKEAQLQLAHGHPQGKTVERYGYKWGERLSKRMMIANDLAGKNYEGMVRFPRDSGVGTKYMTFRVMKEGTTGWTYPGLHIAEKAARASKFVVQRIIQQGFEADKKAFMEMYL